MPEFVTQQQQLIKLFVDKNRTTDLRNMLT